jgi:DNA-binding Lrp family transcriptional regulator
MPYVLNADRAADEVLLDVLARRDRGQSASAIAAALGKTRNAVLKIIKRIRDDDIAHDPTAAAYWRNQGDDQ